MATMRNLYIMSASEIYPNKEGMSLYNFHGKPIQPIDPVITMPTTQAGTRYFHLGKSKAVGFFI